VIIAARNLALKSLSEIQLKGTHMNSTFNVLLFTLLFTPLTSLAAVFDFSYVFQSGYGDNRGIGPTSVTGSFNGEQEGLYVTHLSNINVQIEGRDFSQNLISVFYSPTTGTPWDLSQEGTISFDLMLNNFQFVDAAYATSGTFTNYFYLVSDSNIQRQAFNNNGGHSYGFDNSSLTNQSWKLTAREVPEPSTLFLLAFGLIPLVLKRFSLKKGINYLLKFK
jgi:hypothetical protein